MATPAPSAQELYDIAKAELVSRRPDLQVLPGDISDMLLWAIAAGADRVVGFTAERFRATYVDGARGEDLTTLASDHFGLERFEAVQAVGSVTFSRSNGPSAPAGTISLGTVVATTKDINGVEVRFTTDADQAWLLGENGSKSVGVTAEIGGKSGNVAAAKINRIITSLFDTFTVTNAALTAGGAEAESDQELRERIRGFNQSLRRGTLDALEFGAKQVQTVHTASASQDATGLVTVYVSDEDGNSNADMVADAAAELVNWIAAGITVQVLGAVVYTLTPITITLQVRSHVDVAAITSQVKNAIVARIGKLRIGETATRSAIQQAAMNVDIDNIIGVSVIAPAADVVPTANQVIRTTAGDISVA